MAGTRRLNIPTYESVESKPSDSRKSESTQDSRHRRARSTAGRQSEFLNHRRLMNLDADYQARQGNESAALKVNARNAGLMLMNRMKKSGIVKAGTTSGQQREQMSQWQRAYTSTMLFQSVSPLKRGMSPETLLETIGMSATMMLVSPHFRKQVGESIGGIYNAINNRIANLHVKKARDKELVAHLRGGDRNDLRQKWIRRLERAEKAERHGMEPLDAQTAALMEVGIAENAYLEMRAPGANIDEVQEAHQSALAELYSMAERDGVMPAEISQSMRNIVASRLPEEPQLAQVFDDLAHGKFTFNDNGKITDVTTGMVVDRGSYTVRPPEELSGHQKRMREVLAADLRSSLKHSPDALQATMHLHIVGLETSRYPDVASDFTSEGARRRLDQSEHMFAAMRDDGIAQPDAREAYATAFIEAVGEIAEKSPEFAEYWFGSEGERLRADMAQTLQDFNNCAEVRYRDRVAQRRYAQQAEGVRYGDQSAREAAQGSGLWVAGSTGEIIPASGTSNPEFIPELFEPEVTEVGAQGVAELVEQMSQYIGSDVLQSAHAHGGRSRAGESLAARTMYRMRGAIDLDTSFTEAEMRRAQSLRNMRDKLAELGIEQLQQERMLAFSYVRGLEKAILADPELEHVVRGGSQIAPEMSWQEAEYVDALLGVNGHDEIGYHRSIESIGVEPVILDPEYLKDKTYNHRQKIDIELEEPGVPERPVDAAQEALLDVELSRQQIQNRTSGRINRAYNSQEGKDIQVHELDPDAQFGMTGW